MGRLSFVSNKAMRNYIIAILAILFLSAPALFAQGNQPTKEVNGKTYLIHKVISGETFYKIARKHHCTVADLQLANPNVKILHIGDQVLVPMKDALPPVKPDSSIDTKPQTESYVKYIVKRGETLSKIAKEHGTTVQEIKRINHLLGVTLKIGQVLKLPIAAELKPVEPIEQKPEPTPVKTEQPVEKKEIEKPGEDKPKPDIVQPVVVQPVKVAEDKVNPGIPVGTNVIIAETATEKEEKGVAVVMGNKMDQTRTFVMHPTLAKGSIIVLINEATGKMAYCRVVDNIRSEDMNGATIAITRAVAEKLGIYGERGGVKIKYASL